LLIFLVFCVLLCCVFCFVLVFCFCLPSSCVFCTQCYQCLWITHSWFPLRFPLRFSLMFIIYNTVFVLFSHWDLFDRTAKRFVSNVLFLDRLWFHYMVNIRYTKVDYYLGKQNTNYSTMIATLSRDLVYIFVFKTSENEYHFLIFAWKNGLQVRLYLITFFLRDKSIDQHVYIVAICTFSLGALGGRKVWRYQRGNQKP
jgi:hypothetical protein